MVKPGSRTLHVSGVNITANGSSVQSEEGRFGWFFLRIVAELQPEDIARFANDGKIVFKPESLIQNGWFKMYLDELQLAFARSQSTLIALFPVKRYVQPNFSELEGVSGFLVEASEDWQPDPPIQAKKSYKWHYVVKGVSPQELMKDPKVAFVRKLPKMRLL
jgi:hypothetical protein